MAGGCGAHDDDEVALGAAPQRQSLGKADDAYGMPSAEGAGGIERVKGWARDRVAWAGGDFYRRGLPRMPSPHTWADEVVYQIQVDRFADGDPGNNHANISAHQAYHAYRDQRGIADYHHGGDLQGIINRLGYLSHLGVTTLWVTPVLAGTGSYHGYCTSDFTRVDPNFGSAETLRTLTTEAHKRGMRVVLDVVVNHMCSKDADYDGRLPFADWAYNECTNDLNWNRWHGDNTIRGQRELAFGANFFGPLRNQHFFSRCGHKSGDYATFGPGAMFGDFTDEMLDFNTLNWDFQEIFTELHKYWIAYADLDGMRVDAAKHVTEDFLAYFSTELRDYAAKIGKHNFMLVGEVAASAKEQSMRVGKMRSNRLDPGDVSANLPSSLRERLRSLRDRYLAHQTFPYPGLNAVYDFGHSGTLVAAMHQWASPLSVKQWFWAGGEQEHGGFSSEFAELAGNGQPLLNWNVLEIHDWPRFAQAGRHMGQLRAALGYLTTGHGVPVLYYGVEQGFDGTCNEGRIEVGSHQAYEEVLSACRGDDHGRFRQDMFVGGPWRLRSLVPEIDALAGIGKGAWRGTNPYLNTSHELFRYVRKLVAARKSCKALRRGAVYFRAAHGNSDGGLLAFSRIYEGSEAVVLVNTSGRTIPLTSLYLDAGVNRNAHYHRYRNLLNGLESATVGALGDGIGLYFQEGFAIGGHQVAIFIHEGNVQPYDGELGAHRCRS